MGEQFSEALCASPPIWAITLPIHTLYVGPYVGSILMSAVVTHPPAGIKKTGIAGYSIICTGGLKAWNSPPAGVISA